MALSAHEMILVLRARDEASRILRSFSSNLASLDAQTAAAAGRQFAQGAALATAGVAIAGVGLAMAQGFNNATKAAIEYGQQVAMTATQVDGAGVSMQQLNQMGKDIAREMPVAFKDVQPALYDIFSSIETNGPEAQQILRGIGKAAIGGQVDMSTAGRGILQIMNAWKLGASDVNHINDVMFQLVRKGVGTYDEFSSTMGRSIPSALRAGQSVETLSAMLAFLTRNGLSTAMASTSAARAMDAMANPKTISHFRDFGIEVANSEGKMRPMIDIMSELKGKMQGMSDTAKSAKLAELFKGSGGTIQAMRFFNLAVSDGNGLLQQMGDYMHNAGGAAQEAYDIMSNTPQAKIQELSNQYDIMKVTIGEKLLPVKMQLIEALTRLVDWFNQLSPGMQDFIIKGAAIFAVLLIVVGVLMAVAGTFLMFSAAATLAGVSLGTVAAIIAGVVVAIGLLVAAGVLIYQNWDAIKAKATEVWGFIVATMTPVVTAVRQVADHIMSFFREVWEYLGPIFQGLWDELVKGAQSIWGKIGGPLTSLYASVMSLFHNLGAIASNFGRSFMFIFDLIKPVLYGFAGVIGIVFSAVKGAIGPLAEMIGNVFANIINTLTGVVDFITGVFTGNWSRAGDAIISIITNMGQTVLNLFTGLFGALGGLVSGAIEGIIGFFTHLWDVLVGHSIVPDMINGIIDWFGQLPGRVLGFVISLVIQVINWFAQLPGRIIELVSSLVGSVTSSFGTMPGRVINAIAGLAGRLVSTAAGWLSSMGSAVVSGIGTVVGYFRGVPGRILGAISGFSLYSVGVNIATSLGNGISSMLGWVADRARALAQSALNAAKSLLGIASPSKVFTYFGKMSGLGFGNGLRDMIDYVTSSGQALAAAAIQPIPSSSVAAMVGAVGTGYTAAAGTKIEQTITIHTNEIDPVKNAADLGWELAVRVA